MTGGNGNDGNADNGDEGAGDAPIIIPESGETVEIDIEVPAPDVTQDK